MSNGEATLSEAVDLLDTISDHPSAPAGTQVSARQLSIFMQSAAPLVGPRLDGFPESFAEVSSLIAQMRSAVDLQDFHGAVDHAATLSLVLAGEPLSGPKPPTLPPPHSG